MKKLPLKEQYEQKIKDQLHKKYGYENVMQIPKLVKIVISMGLAEASKDKQHLECCFEDLKALSGQKAIPRRATKAIANFKLKENQTVGAKVTLRGSRMFDFMYKFTNVCAPRLPDFRGFKRKADGRGSYSLGIKDQTIFPEINLDKMKYPQGMNITFVTSAHTDEECVELLTLMGLPLKAK